MDDLMVSERAEVPWIGKIPDGWSVKRLKHIFSEKKSTKNPILSSGSISFGTVIFKDDESIPESTKESYQEVLEGEFLINPLNLNYDLKSLRIGLSRINVVVSQGYIVLKLKDGFYPQYYEYLMRKFDVEHMKSLGQGVRQTISFTHIKDEELVVPPLEEQKLISRYLDKKTKQIDRLVEKIQRKIELLKEQRTSLINQCVTKGLDPNVEMKDSGVEWIGEIPKHWDVKKLKYISQIKYGISPHESTYNDEGRGTVLINGPVEYSTTYFGYTRSIKWTTEPKNMVPKGSLLFCVRGSTTGRMNICHQDVSIGSGVCSIESRLDQDFTVFSMLMIRIYIQDKISGSTFPSVVKEDVDNFVLPCPPIEEQRSISKIVTEKVEVIEHLIDVHSQKKDHLKEYRQSLISSVVTGKVRVTEDMI